MSLQRIGGFFPAPPAPLPVSRLIGARIHLLPVLAMQDSVPVSQHLLAKVNRTCSSEGSTVGGCWGPRGDAAEGCATKQAACED